MTIALVTNRSNRKLALALGLIGIAGEMFALRHLLVNCYPFKMFAYPPAQFYSRLGNWGSVAVLAASVAAAVFLARKWPPLVPPLTTVLAPLGYFAVGVIATSVTYGWSVPAGTRNFDDYRIGEATAEFFNLGGSCR